MAHSQRTTPTLAPTSTFSSTLRLATQALFAAVVALLVLAWWLCSPLHHMPLERDEGAYAVIAALGQLRWLGRWPAKLLGMALLCALLASPVREIWSLRTLSPDR